MPDTGTSDKEVKQFILSWLLKSLAWLDALAKQN